MRIPGVSNPLATVLSYLADDPEVQNGKPVPYTGLGGKSFLIAALAGLNPITQAQGAYGAARHPVRRLQQPGQMAYPLAGRYAPKTKGLTAESLQRGDPLFELEHDRLDPSGEMVGVQDRFMPAHPGHRAYNLRNEKGDIVASADRMNYPAGRPESGQAYVPQMWVRPDYRKTTAMLDLYNLLSRGGKTKIRATFANDKLEKVFNRYMDKKRPNYEARKAMTAKSENPAPDALAGRVEDNVLNTLFAIPHDRPGPMPPARRPLPNPSLSKPIPRQDTIALALALKMEREGRMRPQNTFHQRLARTRAHNDKNIALARNANRQSVRGRGGV